MNRMNDIETKSYAYETSLFVRKSYIILLENVKLINQWHEYFDVAINYDFNEFYKHEQISAIIETMLSSQQTRFFFI